MALLAPRAETYSPAAEGRAKHDRLSRFPYRQEIHQLHAINRPAQRRKMWSRVRNPCRACSDGKSVMVTILCWSGLVFTLGALLISFYKDGHDESEQSTEVVFDLSVAELLLTLVAVLITLAKQTTIARQVDDTRVDLERHDDSLLLSSSQPDVSVVMPHLDVDDDDGDGESCWSARSTTSKFLFVALFGWLTSSIILIASFVGFYLADRESHSYLRQMKYITSLVLFLSIICDAVITEIFHEALSHAKLDVCRLVALQLKTELFHELAMRKDHARIQSLEEYFASTKQFAHHKLDHIALFDNVFSVVKDRLPIDDINKPKFENIQIEQSPQLRMSRLQERADSCESAEPISPDIVKAANGMEECVVLETKNLEDD